MPELSPDALAAALVDEQASIDTPPPAPLRAFDGPRLGRVVRKGIPWILGGGVVYLLAPSILGVLAASNELVEIDWWWLVALVVAQLLVLYLTWVLQRLLIHDDVAGSPSLALIASTQLVGNAVATAAPFGGAAGTAAQVRALQRRGVDPRRSTSGILTFSLLQVASVGALAVVGPIMVLFGVAVPPTLAKTALLGCGALVLITVLLVVMLRTDRAVDWIGAAIGKVVPRQKKRIIVTLRRERRHLRRALSGRGRAPKVLGVALARSIADYLCLLAAVAAVTPTPNPALGAARVRRRRGAAHAAAHTGWPGPGRGRAHPAARGRRVGEVRCGARDPRLPHGVAVAAAAVRHPGGVVASPQQHRGRLRGRPRLRVSRRLA